MRFQDYRQEGQRLGIGGDYFKLEQGENKIRLLSPAEPSITHFLGIGQKAAPCVTGCIHCKSSKKTVKMMLYVLDRKDDKIKLAELPWSVFKIIGELAESSEYGFQDLPPYDLVITRTGEGMKTCYQVMPGRNQEPVSITLQNELATKKPVKEIIEARKAPLRTEEAPPLDEMPPDIESSLPF